MLDNVTATNGCSTSTSTSIESDDQRSMRNSRRMKAQNSNRCDRISELCLNINVINNPADKTTTTTIMSTVNTASTKRRKRSSLFETCFPRRRRRQDNVPYLLVLMIFYICSSLFLWLLDDTKGCACFRSSSNMPYYNYGRLLSQTNHQTVKRSYNVLQKKRQQQFQKKHRSGVTLLSSSMLSPKQENKSIVLSFDEIELLTKLKRSRLKEFFQIAVPALIQLAAEPLAGLVDTAYLGRLGPSVLGGAGVAISAQYAVGKLYNDPLLRTSISLVAAQDGKNQQQLNQQQSDDDNADDNGKRQLQQNKDLSVAVSTALLLALTVGIVQMIVYGIFCKSITRAMGLVPTNEMWNSCIGYLQIRALGTPAATLWLVTNGIFRGLRDTRTPLFYSIFFTVLNAILDPLFIFTFQLGAAGAAAGTAIAQYVALIPLMIALNRKVPINIIQQWKQLGPSLVQYVRAGGLVLFRSIAKVMAYSVCARQAALLGSVSAAAYNLTFQLGFATTQICEAVAVAVQTLLARELSAAKAAAAALSDIAAATDSGTDSGSSCSSSTTETITPVVRTALARYLINTSVKFGGSVALLLSMVTFWRKNWIIQGLSTNIQVQEACLSIFPIVLLTQILKGLAYPVNGILMGGLDWLYSMGTMWFANIVCIGMIQYWLHAKGIVTLQQLWIALAIFMLAQVVAGIVRYESKRGIWSILQSQQR